MKKILIVFLLASCSAPYHIRKAIKKDPTIITEKIDTVRFTFNTIDTIERVSNDTIITEIILRRVDTMFLTKYKYIDADDIRTRQEVRQEEKTERTKSRQDGKTDRTETRQVEKTERTEARKSWVLWLVIGLILLLALLLILKDRRR